MKTIEIFIKKLFCKKQIQLKCPYLDMKFTSCNIPIKISQVLAMVKILKENTWDKDLADKIIENLNEIKRII